MSTNSILAAVLKSAEHYADRTALIGGEEKVSYRELVRLAQSAAAHIARLAPGENIGIFLPNSIHSPPHVLGALWAGKIIAVLPTLAPAPLLKLMFAEAKLTTVFTSSDLAPRLAEAAVPYVLIDPTYPPAKEFALQTRPHEAALLLYPSGTTGRPKAVALSERNIISNAEGCKDATGFDDRQVMLAILPLFHAYGLTVTNLLPLMTGSTVVVLERFVPRTVLNAIA